MGMLRLNIYDLNKKVPPGSGTYKFGFAKFLTVSRYVVALGISYKLKNLFHIASEFVGS